MVVGSVKEIANAIFFGNNTTKAAHIRLLDRKGFSTHKNRNLVPSAKTKPQKNLKAEVSFTNKKVPILLFFFVQKK
jgi:hypothetical protein